MRYCYLQYSKRTTSKGTSHACFNSLVSSFGAGVSGSGLTSGATFSAAWFGDAAAFYSGYDPSLLSPLSGGLGDADDFRGHLLDVSDYDAG